MKTLKEYLEHELSEASESEHRNMIKGFLADINRAVNYIDTVKEDCDMQACSLENKHDLNWDCYSMDYWESMRHKIDKIKRGYKMNLKRYNINQLHRAYKNINKDYLVFDKGSIRATNLKLEGHVLNDITLKEVLRKELMTRLKNIACSWGFLCYHYTFDCFLDRSHGITKNMYKSLLKLERTRDASN